MRKTPAFIPDLLSHPWFLLGWFCLVNGLLSFGRLPAGGAAALMVLGWAPPLAAALVPRREGRMAEGPLWSAKILPAPSRRLLAVLVPAAVAAAAFLRFADMTSLSRWPLTDEAKNAYFALQWAQEGKARLLYDFSQLPPLYIWLEGAFFKVFGASLFSLWCFPALLSLATAAAAYPAARAHFPGSYSFLFAALMAFSFWPLYVGRFSNQGPLLLLWECLALWMAGVLAKAERRELHPTRSHEDTKGEWKEKKNEKTAKAVRFFRGLIPGWGSGALKYGLALGLLAGGGFYTFPAWVPVAAVLGLWVFSFHRRATLPFLAGLAVVYFPLGLAALRQGYGGYLRYVWVFHPGQAWGPALGWGFRDFSAFFWKTLVPPNLFAYKPFWGGFLNFLLGACFFIGVAAFFRQAAGPWKRFWSAAFLLFYLPGFLTGGLDMFRVVPLLPLLLAGAALGLGVLLSSLRPSRRWPALAALLCLSLSLDAHHLFGVYHEVWAKPRGNWFGCKSLDRLRAYEVLRKVAEQAGPGLVLCQLVPDLYDQSLPLAVHGFNALDNPGIPADKVRWAALLINIHYQAYLQGRFPTSRWYWLAPDAGNPDGGLALGIFPLPGSRPLVLEKWLRADLAMRDRLVPLTFECRDYRSRRPVLGELTELYPLFRGDRFLESCFWEKMAENEYGDFDYAAQIDCLKRAVAEGVPAAHLYNGLAALCFRRGHLKEARRDFRKALACRPNHTSAAEGLRLLEETEKTGKFPKD